VKLTLFGMIAVLAVAAVLVLILFFAPELSGTLLEPLSEHD
jgi:hypothetical protein